MMMATEELMDVNSKYLIRDKEIGSGHYGVVRTCISRATGEEFAIKTIKKSKVPRLVLLKREIEILRAVDHPTLIRLEDVYEDDVNLHLVTELCTGGELFDRIILKTESKEGHYSERDAANIVHKIIGAIEYCHNEHNICHRDLKPENFLFKTKDDQADLKIIDFGLSRFEDGSEAMTTRVGTPYYIAPEGQLARIPEAKLEALLSKKYDKACDLWSIGVIMFILLCGYPPFSGANDAEIFKAVQRVDYRFLSPEWDSVSDEAKDLIRKLLVKDPTARLTASQALVHPWFEKVMSGDAAAQTLRDSALRLNHRLRRFSGANALKKIALNVIAEDVGDADEGHLRKVFNSLDLNGDGEITVDELQQVIASEGMVGMQAEVLELLNSMDKKLDYRNFLAATMEKRIFLRRENLRKAFEHFDLQGTGSINKTDLMEALGSEDCARTMLEDIDMDHDGQISFDEFSEMMRRL
ncbi:unnamed protein product [Ectocarpus sp. 12 AP-2014]